MGSGRRTRLPGPRRKGVLAMFVTFRIIGNSQGLMVDGVGFAKLGLRWVFWMSRATGKVSMGENFYEVKQP